jgi:hypothetical protein
MESGTIKAFIYKTIAISLSFVLLTSFKAIPPIVLKNEAIDLKPEAFFIAGVTDERAVKTAVAQIITRNLSTQIHMMQFADLQGGLAFSVETYIKRNLLKDQTLNPVMISIKDFKLTETLVQNGGIEGQLKVVMSFSLLKNYGLEPLYTYKGGLRYIRYKENLTLTEGHFRSMIFNGLNYFNEWMKANADENRKLAKEVKIKFSEFSEDLEGDTIYYSKNRPLTWSDFQSRYRPRGKYVAEVMPGIGYSQEAEVKKGIIQVKFAMKTYLPKSTCKVDYSSKNSYTLNHEQRHFDIAKIVSDHFKQQILKQRLTPDNFEAIINMQYLETYRELDTMQKAYDKETTHGVNTFAQAEWNNKIDEMLTQKAL